MPVGTSVLAQERQIFDYVGLTVLFCEREQGCFEGGEGDDWGRGKRGGKRFFKVLSYFGEWVFSGHFLNGKFKIYLLFYLTGQYLSVKFLWLDIESFFNMVKFKSIRYIKKYQIYWFIF